MSVLCVSRIPRQRQTRREAGAQSFGSPQGDGRAAEKESFWHRHHPVPQIVNAVRRPARGPRRPKLEESMLTKRNDGDLPVPFETGGAWVLTALPLGTWVGSG